MAIGKSMSRPAPGRPRRGRFRASLERLEPRKLMATFSVTNTADAGPGSLRAAIQQANANPDADNIRFSIPASTSPNLDVPVPGFDPVTQTWRISLATPLPAITDPLTVDGYTQAQFPVPYRYPRQLSPDPTLIASTPNTISAKDGNDAAIRVIVDGSQAGGAAGFEVGASHSVIRGLAIDGFGVGVSVADPGVVGTLIQGNSIGKYYLFLVDPSTGEPLPEASRVVLDGRGNALQGVLLGSTNATVGGTRPQENNVIAGNGLQGVSILPGAVGNQVIGNQIGIAGPTSNGLYVVAPNGAEGVRIASSSNYVGGTAAGAGNLISGNVGDGVHVVGPASTENQVRGNYIGVGPGGGFRFGVGDPGNLGDGVRIEDAGNNIVGGSADSDRNVISANEGAGVRIFGVSALGNRVLGNVIGLTAGGSSALGNSREGVAIFSPNNVVGPGNVISANLRGVLLSGPGATGNRVLGNRIGTDSSGIADLGNAFEGVRIDGASDNQVVGDASGSQAISGNNVGVLIIGPTATRNRVAGNFIGTDVAGTSPLGNSQEGVRVENSPGNTVGGTVASGRNVISANHWGVVLSGGDATGNFVPGNFIGTDVSGSLPLGNELDGVLITNEASGDLVGGASVAAGNTIAFNLRDGVRVEGTNTVRNAILTNRIFSNLGLGIRLVGGNLLQNAPILTAVATSVAFTNIRGALNSTPNTTFTIQFFASTQPDPSGRGEGERFLGQATVTTGADGVANFSADVPATVAAGQVVTATATDPSGNTSGFSNAIGELLGTVQFQMSGFTVGEGGATATIVVTRSGGSGGLFTVDFATADGTARAGVDYLPASGTLTFSPGEDSRTFTITLLDDSLPEADETVLLTLGNPTGAATLGTPATAVLTIADDDQPGALRFLTTGFVVDEAAGTASITVVRDSSGGLVTVGYATADGTARAGVDYLPASGTLVFNPGETIKTFTVPILLDSSAEGEETVILNLFDPTGGATLGSPSSATLVIRDDTVDRRGPRVASVRAIAGRPGVAAVVVAFDEPLDPARAVDLLNYGYSVRIAGRDGRLGTRDDLLIGLRPATYDPATLTLTLPLSRAVARKMRMKLLINQATDVASASKGVADLAGNLLDGDGNGRPGGVFSAVVVARQAPKQRRAGAKAPVVGHPATNRVVSPGRARHQVARPASTP